MKSIDVFNLSKPIWPGALTRVAAQRDRARNVAIRLEQENADLIEFLIGIGACTASAGAIGLARAAETADEVLDHVRDVLRVWHQL